jgi:hypothetical protein
MAFIRLKNGKGIVISAEQANVMWSVFNKEKIGNEEQQKFCKLIKQIHFNPKTAPKSWLNKQKTTYN